MLIEDKNAVEAVLRGDKERYAELVARYQNMVYAIAWSHLGDADHSEDASQDAFIKAYRYLRSLRQPEKFAGWLARIARNVSISLGRKHKRELEQRRRWELEQPRSVQPAALGNADPSMETTLQQGLNRLSADHREALVLFYVENKSVQELAESLGISEAAAKTRLHRARKALRVQVEQLLEPGLRELRPPRNFAAGILPLLPLQPIGAVGIGGTLTLGSKISAISGKALAVLAYALWTVAIILEMFGLMWAIEKLNARMFHKDEGNDFRRRLATRGIFRMAVAGGAAIAIMNYFTIHYGFASMRFLFFIVGLHSLYIAYNVFRRYRVSKNRFMLGVMISIGVLAVCGFSVGLGAPLVVVFPALCVFYIVAFFANKYRPWRMDYNLFLREATGGLGDVPENESDEMPSPTPIQMTQFANYLGRMLLVTDYAVDGGGRLILKLEPMKRFAALGGVPKSVSSVIVRSDGKCEANLHPTEFEEIRAVTQRELDQETLQKRVSTVMHYALRCFLLGESDKAQAVLCAVPDSEVFATNPQKAKGVRVALILGFAWCVAMLWLWLAAK